MNPDDYNRVRQAFAQFQIVAEVIEQSAMNAQAGGYDAAVKVCEEAWKDQFRSHSGGSLDLSGADLSGGLFAWTDRSGRELLRAANFRGAILDRTTWMFLSLKEADFSGASMRQSKTWGVFCNGALFREADLSGSLLTLMCGQGAPPVDFTGANLTGTTLSLLGGEPFVFTNAAMLGCRIIFNGGHKERNAFLESLSDEQRSRIVLKGPKGKCFIATAACGSIDAPEVCVLRQFRDSLLCRTLIGRAFISTYELCSPPLACLISHSEGLRVLVRKIIVLRCSRIARRIMQHRLKENWSQRKLVRQRPSALSGY